MRPRWPALPESEQLFTTRGAELVVAELDSAVRARGFTIQRIAPREGYLETRWFDLAANITTGAPFSNMDRVVKLRFFVDPIQGRTRVLAEAVVRRSWDPSLPERDLEHMAVEGHPGRLLLDSLITPFKPDTTVRQGGPPLPERRP